MFSEFWRLSHSVSGAGIVFSCLCRGQAVIVAVCLVLTLRTQAEELA